MKKLFATLLSLLLLIISVCFADGETNRETFLSGEYEYALLEDGTAEVVRWKGDAEALEIAETLDDVPVTSIGERSFTIAYKLNEIIIPSSIVHIGDGAFAFCNTITSISIPDETTQIGSNPFEDCRKLIQIRVSPDHPTVAVIDGVLFGKTDKRVICYPVALEAEEYAIPRGIEIIGQRAFYRCRNLTEVLIPDTVTTIESSAFSGCSGLAEIVIPEGVTSIGPTAFIDCSGLKAVRIPASVTEIGSIAFFGCDEAVFTVERDSYAAEYCRDNDLQYTYPDANDWLNG